MSLTQEKEMQQIIQDKIMKYAGDYIRVERKERPDISTRELLTGKDNYYIGSKFIIYVYCRLVDGVIWLMICLFDGSLIEQYNYEGVKNCDITEVIKKILEFLEDDMYRSAIKYAELSCALENMTSVIKVMLEKE